MMSRKEVADAFNAAAAACGVSVKERGQLLAFLGSIPKVQLEFMPINVDNKATVQFVKDAYWSRGYHMTATLMMEALRDIQVLPGPGKVLSVGPHASFHLHPDYDSLFVRECYPRLFDAIVREPTPTRYIVTGTPGIGISWFFYYLLARLLKSTEPPPYIVWEHMTQPGMAWCYTHETGQVVFRQRSSFSYALGNPAAWYISDGVPPMLNGLARTVLLTTPERKIFKEMHKEHAEMLYMPCWEWDELLACKSLLYDTVDEALAKELYEHYGGVVRYVLKFPYGRPDKGLDELLESLHWAVGACFGEQLQSAIRCISTGSDASHELLHIVANKDSFSMEHLAFASLRAAEEVAKKAAREDLQELLRVLATTSGVLHDTLFEATMRVLLPKGRRFTAVPFNYDASTSKFQRGDKEKIVLDRSTEQEFFKVLPETATEGTYYSSSTATFPTVFKRGKHTCDIFHVAVGDSEQLDAGALTHMLTELQLPVGVTPRLHFVAPKDTYHDFKVTAGKNWPQEPSQGASRVEVYVTKGVHTRLQGVAPSMAGNAPKRLRC